MTIWSRVKLGMRGWETGEVTYTRRAVIGNLALVIAAALSVAVILFSLLILIAARRVGPLEQARRQAIAAICAQRGLVSGVGADDLSLLGRIDPRWLTNAYSSADQGLTIADFVRPAGKNTQFFTVLSFTVPGLNMPNLAVTLRNLEGPVLGGLPAIELESTEFDKRFVVRARERRSAVMLLDPGMMQLVLDCGIVSFEMVGDKLLAFINRAAEPRHRPADPVEFDTLLRFQDGFAARVPALLRNEYTAQA